MAKPWKTEVTIFIIVSHFCIFKMKGYYLHGKERKDEVFVQVTWPCLVMTI